MFRNRAKLIVITEVALLAAGFRGVVGVAGALELSRASKWPSERASVRVRGKSEVSTLLTNISIEVVLLAPAFSTPPNWVKV